MSEQIVTFHPKKKKEVIVRDPNERILTIDEVRDVAFSELKVMNLVLTNACNLSCSYCFEQHKKDYGRFDLESLKKMYDFFIGCNDLTNKRFQFFGGEPLAQKKLILDFIRTYDDMLVAGSESVKVSIVTNGLLLTPEFIEEFCNKPYANMCISLDTHNAEVDKRDIDQEGIDYILKMVALIPQKLKDEHKLAMRITINQESVYHFEEYVDKLYGLGVRHLVIHPLIMSREQGFLEWEEKIWEDHHESLVRCINRYSDLRIEWAEGVGVKGQSNCMVGSDMITVDGSGEFSGCYFFTNLKEDLPHTLLGNVLKDEIYIDRYQGFQKQYSEFNAKHEECQSCDYRNFCYQCPAGNAALGGELFRPDGMCKRIVKLFIVLRQDINKKQAIDKIKRIQEAYNSEGEIVLSRVAIHLMHRYFHGVVASNEELRDRTDLPGYRKVLAQFYKQASVDADYRFSIDGLIEDINIDGANEWSAHAFYQFICEKLGITRVPYKPAYTMEEECSFLGLMHLPLFDDSRYTTKSEPEHSRSRLFDL